MDLITAADGCMDDKTYFLFVDWKTGKNIAQCRVVGLSKYYEFSGYNDIDILDIHWGNHRIDGKVLSIPELYISVSSK